VSDENVQIAHRIYEAANRHDVEAILSHVHPEMEGVSFIMDADGDTFRGPDGMRRFLGELFSVFPDFDAEILSVEAGADLVVIELRLGGHGAGSGARVQLLGWQVATFRDGKVVAWRGYATREEAMAAAGLSG
jgi:ketosteroid isomerase-like protein